MNLENEILQLCFDVLEKEMTPLQAQKEILRLLDVVGQSEQLKAFLDYVDSRYSEQGTRDRIVDEFLSL